jgi:PAS domain S-box-containing protein
LAADQVEENMYFSTLYPKVWQRVAMNGSGGLELQDGLWVWKTLSPVDTFNRLSRMFPQHLVAFDQLISDNFSLTLVAHRPPASLVEVRRENRMLISLVIVSGLSVYGLSLFFYLSGHARARQAEVQAAHALARATHMARMKELEERFHRVVEASSIGQLVVDEDGLIEITNPAAERMFGYASGELEGGRVDSLLPAGLRERHVQLRAQFMQAPEARQMGVGRELMAVRNDGSTFPVEIGLTPYTDQGRQLVLVSIIDLSGRNGGTGRMT